MSASSRAHAPDDQPASEPERISVDLLKAYIANVTSAWFGQHDLPPDSVDELAPYAADAGRHARRDGNWEVFRTGLRLLITTPGIDLGSVSTGQYPYDDEEMREILGYVYERLYGPRAAEPPGTVAGPHAAILDWAEAGTDWLVRHGRLHAVRAGETLRSIAAQHGLSVDELLERNPYYQSRYGPDRPLRARPGETVVRLTP